MCDDLTEVVTSINERSGWPALTVNPPSLSSRSGNLRQGDALAYFATGTVNLPPPCLGLVELTRSSCYYTKFLERPICPVAICTVEINFCAKTTGAQYSG